MSDSTSISIENAQVRLLELQAQAEQTFAQARFLLVQAADEQRRLRHEVANVNLKIYTEAEAASELKISEKTLKRQRLSHPETWPCSRIGDLVRYTNFHLVEIMELQETRRKEGETRKRKSHLRQVGT